MVVKLDSSHINCEQKIFSIDANLLLAEKIRREREKLNTNHKPTYNVNEVLVSSK